MPNDGKELFNLYNLDLKNDILHYTTYVSHICVENLVPQCYKFILKKQNVLCIDWKASMCLSVSVIYLVWISKNIISC